VNIAINSVILVFADSSYVPPDEIAGADKSYGEARKTVRMLMARKQASQKGRSSPVRAKASKKGKSVLDSALEVQSEEEDTQPFAVSKSATLKAKKDAENRKRNDVIAEAEEIFEFQETDSRLNLSGSKRKSTQQNKAESKARNATPSGSDSDSVSELKMLLPKKSSTLKNSKLDSSANILDDEQAVSTRSKGRSASEGKGRTPVRSSPRKNSRAPRDSSESSVDQELSPMSKKLKSAADAKRSTRLTSKKSNETPNKSGFEQITSGDSDLEIVSPNISKTPKSSPVKKRTAVASGSSKKDEEAKRRKPNDESESSDDTVLFKSQSTPGRTVTVTRSSRSSAGPNSLLKSLVVSLTPLKMTRSPVKKSSEIVQSQQKDSSSKADPEGTKIITRQGTQGSNTKPRKSQTFDLTSDDDSDNAAKVQPKRLVRPTLKKGTMLDILDSDGGSSSDDTFSKRKKKDVKRKKPTAASSSKKDESNKTGGDELVGVKNMIEYLQTADGAKEVQTKTFVTRTRNRSLLSMLEVNVPADETGGELNL
jgi:hypothetical protein